MANSDDSPPSSLDRRSGRDRRSGGERRRKTLLYFDPEKDRRSGAERRKPEEDRAGWIRVSRHSSAYVGIFLGDL